MDISKEKISEIKKYPLNKRIRMLRLTHCLSQKEFAKIMNVSSVAVSNWESGKHTPHLVMIYKIIREFGLPQDFFYDIISEE